MRLFFRQLSIGRIGIAEEDGSITNLYFETDAVPPDAEIRETGVIREGFRQLEAYLAGDLKSFSVPVAPRGTTFMSAVWKILCSIPYGETASYKEVATAAGKPKAFRAVGLASNRNPIPLFIPCHRVIGSNGKMAGYRGGLDVKSKLLELEKRHGNL